MPAKRRGEADARALLRKFGRALDSDDSPTRVRRPGGSGLAAVRSAAATTPSATAPTSWVAAWGLVPHLPALKKSGPRRSARATPAAELWIGTLSIRAVARHARQTQCKKNGQSIIFSNQIW